MAARQGRPKSAEPLKRAYQVKLAEGDADAFDAYVRRRSEESTGSPDVLSAAAVLRMMIRSAVALELLEPKRPKRPKQGKDARS